MFITKYAISKHGISSAMLKLNYRAEGAISSASIGNFGCVRDRVQLKICHTLLGVLAQNCVYVLIYKFHRVLGSCLAHKKTPVPSLPNTF